MTPQRYIAPWPALIDAASEPYRRSGRWAWHAAGGKLRFDPVFRHLITRGLITPQARVLDIGCGRGLLASLLAAASQAAACGRWPAEWGAAPLGVRVTGIDLQERDVAMARVALGDAADFICADMRSVELPPADEVVILDALHYVSLADQDRLLARVRGTLPMGGRLLLRVGDRAARAGFASSFWVDRLVSAVSGRAAPQRGRSLSDWQHALGELGFEVASQPMRAGTPFANVLLVGTVRAAAQPTDAAAALAAAGAAADPAAVRASAAGDLRPA